MHVKKTILAVLLCILLCAALSGCGNTLVEHRFDAGTLDAAAEAVAPDVARAVSQLDSLLVQHGITFRAGIQELKSPASPGGPVTQQAIQAQNLEAWLENPSASLYLYTTADDDPSMAEQLVLWKEQLQAFYRALAVLDADSWEQLEQQTAGKLYLTGRITARGGQMYLESALTARA